MSTKTLFVIALASTSLLACDKTKSEAQQGAKDVKAACDEDKEKGQKLGKEWYGKNEVFKKAIDDTAAGWKVKAENFNYCGVTFVEAKSRIEN